MNKVRNLFYSYSIYLTGIFWKTLVISIFFYLNTAFSQNVFYSRSLEAESANDYRSLYLSPSRLKVDLNGLWQFSSNGSPWKNVVIPSSYDFVDKVSFQRHFTVPIEIIKNKCLQLICYGINYQCEVYINNEFVGHHVGGYSSFSFKIPENILNFDNSNQIKIIVDNELNAKETVPLKQQIWGWRNLGGIFRDIYILATPVVYFDDVYIQPELERDLTNANLKIGYNINSTDLKKLKFDTINISQPTRSSFNIYFQVFEKSSNSLVAQSQVSSMEIGSNRNFRYQTEFNLVNPNLWSPGTPSIYILRSFISKDGKIIDQYEQEFGVRKVTFSNGDFYLNGKQILLKGIGRVEDYPNLGNAVSYDDCEKDIILIKNLGVNILINRFFPPSPYLVWLCDKYGIFLCEEIPVWNVPADLFLNELYNTNVETYLREMILRDRNHPSIFAWGIGSNFDSSDPQSIPFCEKMSGVIRSLDNRFSYYSTNMITNDVCSKSVDLTIAIINEPDIKVFNRLVQKWQQKTRNRPIIIQVTGAAIQPENHNGYGDPQSVEYQAHYILNRYRALHQDGINGIILSTFADWRGDRPLLQINNQNQYLYTSGLLSENREPRISYNMLKTLYNEEKIPTLIPGDFNSTHPLIYILWGLILLLLFAYVFNSYRRFRENIVRSFLRPYNFFADIRDQRIFSNIQTTIMAFIISGTFALVLSNLCYFYRTNEIFDYILSHFITSNTIKAWLNTQIWSPTKFILIFTLFNLLLCLIATIIIKLGAVIARRKIFIADSYAIVIWSALPSILLVPLGMILSRIIEKEYLIPVLIFILIEIFWILYRLLKGISIVYDVRMSKIYLTIISLIVLFGGALLIYLNYENSTIAYMKFVLSMFSNSKI
jgi:beta-galactosidase